MNELPITTEFYADYIGTEAEKKMHMLFRDESGNIEESGRYIYALIFPYLKVGAEEVRGKRKFRVTVEEVDA